MKISTLTKVAVFVFFSILGYLYAPHMRPSTASASAIWCGMLAPASNNTNDCLAGQDYNTCTVVSLADTYPNCGVGQTQDQLKQDLINSLSYFSSSAAQHFQNVSASFIESRLGNNWQTNIMNPNVKVSVYAFPYLINRAYDPSLNNGAGGIVSYSDPNTQLSLVIEYNGQYDAIKLNCGNPVGSFNLVIPPKVTISGSIYYYDSTSGSSTNLPNIVVSCSTGSESVITNSATGTNYSFKLWPGTNFCISVPSTFTASNGAVYGGVVITPAYIKSGAPPGGSPPPGITASCNGSTNYYSQQIANKLESPGNCDYGNYNNQYNIAYTSSTKCTSNCNTVGTGSPSCATLQPSYPQNIYLPTTPAPAGTVGSVPGATSVANSTVTVATPNNSFAITSAQDQYGTAITWLQSGYSPNPLTLDYFQYVAQYPYDEHTTTVSYSQQYTEQTYVASHVNPGSQYCTPYGSPTNCLYTDDASGNVGCNIVTDTTCMFHYGTLVSYPPTYSYVATGPASTVDSQGTAQTQFAELCPRNFEVLQPTSTDVTGVTISAGVNTPDMPNQATVSTKTTVDFSATSASWVQNAVRVPISVNGINYTGNYYIEHANGSGQVPIASPDNQTFNIGSAQSPPQDVSYPYFKSFGVSLPPLEVGDQVCAQFTITPQSGEVDNNGNIQPGTTSGSVDSTQIPAPPTCSNSVANYPYSRAYGNDVITGIDFSNSAVTQCNTSASIIASINPDSSARPRGSGAQFAVLSVGQIVYFASAFLRSATATAINGLSLANSSGGYGGYYDTGCQSIYNYFLNRNQVPSANATVIDGQTYGVDSNTGPIQLTFSGAGSDNYIVLQGNNSNSSNISGEHVIYVTGNVYIPNNITYNSSGASYNATTGTVSAVPNLYVIASGNIYIGPNVTQLDGIYVAQNQCDWSLGAASCDPNSGSGGIINTCSDPTGVGSVNSTNESDAFSGSTLFTNCEQQLTISGALVGHEVKLDRTYASMRNSIGGENPIGGGIHRCQDGNGTITPATAPDCSAEIFNFNPINYLGNPGFSANGYNFDSIISLPPVL